MSSSNSPCAACKFLRRKCTQGCVFAPYFPPDNPAKFSHVHRVFGASNVAKLLNDLPPAQREDAVNSLAYEAEARLHDPVYGCVGYISALQHRLLLLQRDLFAAKKELSQHLFQTPAAAMPPIIAYRDQNQYHQQDQEMVNVQQLAEAVAVAREQEMREIERLIAGGGDVVAVASPSLPMGKDQQRQGQIHDGRGHYLHHNHLQIAGNPHGPSS